MCWAILSRTSKKSIVESARLGDPLNSELSIQCPKNTNQLYADFLFSMSSGNKT